MTAALERTILPPADAGPQLRRALAAARQGARLVGPDGVDAELPDDVVEVLHAVLTAQQQGQAITVAPQNTMLRTQAAARLLGISRPTLVSLLESGEIPFEVRGNQRRVRLVDVLAYQQRQRRAAEDVFNEMVQQGEDDGLYDTTADR